MKCTQSSNFLQAPAVKAPPQSMSRLTPDWEVTYYPPSVPTTTSKTNQPRWPAHWPGPCVNQGNCLQWVSDSPYGILCAPILWQPNTPGAQPHMIHSYWYIADTPGPALLGLPACGKLAVVQVNCAVKTTQPNRSPMSTTPTQAARAARPPAARTLKSKCINSTDDLTREFPDSSLELASSQVNIRYNCTQMLIQSYIHTENVWLHYAPRSKTT